jgi:hypothetical protein
MQTQHLLELDQNLHDAEILSGTQQDGVEVVFTGHNRCLMVESYE